MNDDALGFVGGHVLYSPLALDCQTVGARRGAAGGVQMVGEPFIVNGWDGMDNIFVAGVVSVDVSSYLV